MAILTSGSPQFMSPVQVDLYVPDSNTLLNNAMVRAGRSGQSQSRKTKDDEDEMPYGRGGESIEYMTRMLELDARESAIKDEIRQRDLNGEDWQSDPKYAKEMNQIVHDRLTVQSFKPLMKSNMERMAEDLKKFDKGELGPDDPLDDGNGNIIFQDQDKLVPITVKQYITNQWGDKLGTTFQGYTLPDFDEFQNKFNDAFSNLGKDDIKITSTLLEYNHKAFKDKAGNEKIYDVLKKIEVENKDGRAGVVMSDNQTKFISALNEFYGLVNGDPKMERVMNYYRNLYLVANAKDENKSFTERNKYKDVLMGKADNGTTNTVEAEFLESLVGPKMEKRLNTFYRETESFQSVAAEEKDESEEEVHNYKTAVEYNPDTYYDDKTSWAESFNMVMTNVPIEGSNQAFVSATGKALSEMEVYNIRQRGYLTADEKKGMTKEDQKRIFDMQYEPRLYTVTSRTAAMANEMINEENKVISETAYDNEGRIEYNDSENALKNKALMAQLFPNGVILQNGLKMSLQELIDSEAVLIQRTNKNVILPLYELENGTYTNNVVLKKRKNEFGVEEPIYEERGTGENMEKIPVYEEEIAKEYQIVIRENKIGNVIKGYEDAKVEDKKYNASRSGAIDELYPWIYSFDSRVSKILEQVGAVEQVDTGPFKNHQTDYVLPVYAYINYNDAFEGTKKKEQVLTYRENHKKALENKRAEQATIPGRNNLLE